jgi:hypothetical protein
MNGVKELLRPLDRIQPPELWGRVLELEPSDEPSRAARSFGSRVAAAAVALVVFAGGFALALDAFQRDAREKTPGGAVTTPGGAGTLNASPDEPLIATFDAPDDGSMPVLTLEFDGERRSYFAQSGQWPGVEGFPLPLLSFPAELPGGTELRVESDVSAVTGKLIVLDRQNRQTDEEIRLDLASGSASLPDRQGTYGLSLDGEWERGTAGFYVVIQVGQA